MFFHRGSNRFRRRTGFGVALVVLAALTSVAHASATFQRVDAVTLNQGENYLFSAVTDGTYGYFSMTTAPGQVIKIDLATMTRVDAVTLNQGENYLTAAVTHGTYGYFGTLTSPGQVIKIDLGYVPPPSPEPDGPSPEPVPPAYTG